MTLAAGRPDPRPGAAAGGRDRQRHRRLDVRGGAQRHARAGGRRRAGAGRGRLRHARRRRRGGQSRPAGGGRGRGRGAGPGDRRAGELVPAGQDRDGVPISADTFSVEVARRALAAGAVAVNDISGGSEEMFELVAETRLRLRADAHRGAAAGRPALARVRRRGRPPASAWFEGRVELARELGVAEEQIAIDPGLDFDLSPEQDLEILRRLGELRALGPAALRLALAQGLHRRRAGRVLGGAPAGRASASGGRSPRWRWRCARAPTSSASTTAARCRRCGSPAEIVAGRRRSRRADGARRRESARSRPGRSRSTRRGATGGSSPRAPRRSAGRGRCALPAALDPGFAEALRRAGIERLYTHQLEAFEAAADSNLVITSGTASGKSLAFNLPVLDGIAARAEAPRALPLPDQGAGPGPGAQAGAAAPAGPARGDLRRRHAARGAAGDPPPQQPRPHQPRHAPRRPPAPPQELGRLPRQPRAGSSSTRPTPTAASSAPTSPTCCGGCGGWPAPTAPSRASCSPRRRSPTRSSWPSGWSGRAFELIDDDGAPRAGREIAMWNPPLIDKATGARRSALSEAADLLAELVSQGVRTICFLKSRRGIELIQRFARENLERARQAGAGGADRPLPRRLHAAAAARDRGAAEPPASCWRWSRPTRWSWGSTSASSTRRSASPSPAPSPACGRCGAGRGAAGAGSPSTSPARTRSTSSSAATRRSSSGGRSRRRSSTTPTSRSPPGT